MISKLNIASISDIHLGHRQTPTRKIIENLYRAFPDTEATGELDLIIFGGDLFDGPLAHHSDDAILIQLWLFDFLKLCAKRDIVVRVLEGTRSHDWKQNAWFDVVKTISQLDVDVRYVSDLSIEYIERFDIRVLYVPDEWRPETDQTWLEVNQLLKEKALEHVDFTVLHGAFAEQLPEQANVPKHHSDRYESITRYRVLAGHIHQRWVHGRILGNGSFDRLVHGDEGAKGHWRIRVTDSEVSARFIENRHAMLYRTLKVSGLPMDEVLTKIDQETAQYPEGSQVRLQCTSTDPVVNAMDVVKKRYRQFVWSVKTTDRKETQAKLLVDHRPRTKHVPISESNIRQLLTEQLTAMAVSPEIMSRCQSTLTQLGLP